MDEADYMLLEAHDVVSDALNLLLAHQPERQEEIVRVARYIGINVNQVIQGELVP